MGFFEDVWDPALDEAVNKRDLSTGESGEFAGRKAGFGLNPWVDRALPRNLSSNPREPATRTNVRNVADTDVGTGRRCCQQNSRSELGQKCSGSPAWIRTTIHGSKGRCPTIRRPGISRRELQHQCSIRASDQTADQGNPLEW